MPDFVYDAKIPFFNMLVPTVDTFRYSWLLERHLEVGKPVLFTGHSGVGKSVIIADLITKLVDGGGWASLPVSFSAQTSALRTQESIESKAAWNLSLVRNFLPVTLNSWLVTL